MKKIILCILCAGFIFGSSVNIQAKGESLISANSIETRGATDNHYEIISYSITNKHDKKFINTVSVSQGISLGWHNDKFDIGYSYVKSGSYKRYSYKANLTIYTRLVDAMGHNLGNKTFTYTNTTFYEYITL